MPRPFPAGAEPAELERRYRLERSLADRLRAATPAQRPSAYAEVYGEYARQLGTPSADAGSLELQRSLLTPWLRPSMTFAEVGAGGGALARAVAPRVGHVLAVEAVMPEDPGPTSIRWLRHDETEDEIATASVDLAYSCHVVEHLHPDDLPAHLVEVRRWLRPGAPYVMVTPNRLCGPHDISGYFSDEPEGFHLREYTHGELAEQARQAGFGRAVALDRQGRRRALLPRTFVESALDLAGSALRRWFFDGLEPIARRAPLRPLEQVSLAVFAPTHGEPSISRPSTSGPVTSSRAAHSSRSPPPKARRK